MKSCGIFEIHISLNEPLMSLTQEASDNQSSHPPPPPPVLIEKVVHCREGHAYITLNGLLVMSFMRWLNPLQGYWQALM